MLVEQKSVVVKNVRKDEIYNMPVGTLYTAMYFNPITSHSHVHLVYLWNYLMQES